MLINLKQRTKHGNFMVSNQEEPDDGHPSTQAGAIAIATALSGAVWPPTARCKRKTKPREKRNRIMERWEANEQQQTTAR